MIIFNHTKITEIIFNLMGTILSRIQEMASKEGITIGALERKIGASKGVLSRAINNGTDIQSKWIQTIVENYPQYSAEWLLTGMGGVLKETTNNQPPSATNGESHTLLELIREKDAIIREQAEEIGQLRERISMMERRRGVDASDAPNSGIASAG
jgi:hypothetical protein